MEEVIAEIDGAPPPGTLRVAQVAPGSCLALCPGSSRYPIPTEKAGEATGRFTAHPQVRAAPDGDRPVELPSVEHVPVDRELALRYLGSELYGFGALDLLLEAGEKLGAAITDIYVNSPCDIWAGIGGEVRPVALSLGNERRVRPWPSALFAAAVGNWIPRTRSMNVSDEVGRRIHAIIPPLSERTRLSIRLPARERPGLKPPRQRRIVRCRNRRLPASHGGRAPWIRH